MWLIHSDNLNQRSRSRFLIFCTFLRNNCFEIIAFEWRRAYGQWTVFTPVAHPACPFIVRLPLESDNCLPVIVNWLTTLYGGPIVIRSPLATGQTGIIKQSPGAMCVIDWRPALCLFVLCAEVVLYHSHRCASFFFYYIRQMLSILITVLSGQSSGTAIRLGALHAGRKSQPFTV